MCVKKIAYIVAKYEGAGSVEVAIAEILSVFSGSGVVDDSSPGDGTSSLGSPGSSVDALFPHHCPSSERGPVQYFCMAYNRGLDELNRWSRVEKCAGSWSLLIVPCGMTQCHCQYLADCA